MMQNNGMDPQDQRNFILAMALMIGFILIYQVLVVNPEQARRQAELQAAASVRATAARSMMLCSKWNLTGTYLSKLLRRIAADDISLQALAQNLGR